MKLSMRLIAIILGFFIFVATASASSQRSKEIRAIVAYDVGHRLGVITNKNYHNIPNFSRSEYIKGFTAGWNQEKLSPVLQKVLQKILSHQFNEIHVNLNGNQSSYLIGYYTSVRLYKENPHIRHEYSIKFLISGIQNGFDNKKIPNSIAKLNPYFKIFANASKQKLTYAAGYALGRYIALIDIHKNNINLKSYLKGIQDAVNNKPLSSQTKINIKEIGLKGVNGISKKLYSDPNNNISYAAGYEVEDSVLKIEVNKDHLLLSTITKGYIDGIHKKPLRDNKTKKLVRSYKNFMETQ